MKLAPHKKGDYWNGLELFIEDSVIDPITSVETFVPANLTGCTFISRFKTNPTGRVFFEFSTADNSITVPNPIDGKIFFLPKVLNVPAQLYIFDVQMTDVSGRVITIYDIEKPLQFEILQDIS